LIWRIRLIKLRFEIGSFFDQRSRKVRVTDRFSQLEKRCRPPREIVPTHHDASPRCRAFMTHKPGESFRPNFTKMRLRYGSIQFKRDLRVTFIRQYLRSNLFNVPLVVSMTTRVAIAGNSERRADAAEMMKPRKGMSAILKLFAEGVHALR
jgi:hypothetical protein